MSEPAAAANSRVKVPFEVGKCGNDAKSRMRALIQVIQQNASGPADEKHVDPNTNDDSDNSSKKKSTTPILLVLDRQSKSKRLEIFARDTDFERDPELSAVWKGQQQDDDANTLPAAADALAAIEFKASMRDLTEFADNTFWHCRKLAQLDVTPIASLTTIGNSFCIGCTSLVRLNLTGLKQLSKVSSGFCSGCTNLQEVLLTQCSSLVSIGTDFCKDCTSLETLSFVGCDKLTRIGCSSSSASDEASTTIDNSFLSGVPVAGLKTLTLSLPMLLSKNLDEKWKRAAVNRAVDLRFDLCDPKLGSMRNCQRLVVETLEAQHPDCLGFHLTFLNSKREPSLKVFPSYERNESNRKHHISKSHVHILEKKWNELRLPEKILSINLAPLANTGITSVENSFLQGMTALQSIDLSPLKGVRRVGLGFIEGCTSLTSVQGLEDVYSNLEEPIHGLLKECTALETIDLSFYKVAKKHTDMGAMSFINCSKLKKIEGDLSPIAHHTLIPYGFFSGCSSLEAIDLSPLTNITSISDSFLQACYKIETLDLTAFSNVTDVHTSFCGNMHKLHTVDLSPLSKITIFRNHFMHSTALRTVDLASFSNITHIGDAFLNSCSSLETINFGPVRENWSKVVSIGSGFLSGCRSLKGDPLVLPFDNCTSVGDGFMRECWLTTPTGTGSASSAANTQEDKSTTSEATTTKPKKVLDLTCFKKVTRLGTSQFLGGRFSAEEGFAKCLDEILVPPVFGNAGVVEKLPKVVQAKMKIVQ